MAWNIELADDCAVVSMNTNKFNVRMTFFADLHDAESRVH